MKKSLLLFALLIILPFISAAQINMNSNISQGSTLIASVSGNFVTQIQQQNVLLYQGHVRVSFIPTVNKAGDIFYIYGQLGDKAPGNYSLIIRGVKYLEGGKYISADISKNFTISNSTADFSVNPGFIQTSDNANVEIQSRSDNNLNLAYSINSSVSGSVSVNSWQTNSFTIKVTPSSENQILLLVIKSGNTTYNVPVFVPSTSSQQPATPIEVQPYGADISLVTNSNTTRYFYIKNNLGNSTNVSISVSPELKDYITLQNENLTLEPNSEIQAYVKIQAGKTNQTLSGNIIIRSENDTIYFPLSINVSSAFVPSNNSNSTSFFPSCSSLKGNICTGNQSCVNETRQTEEGVCCLGACVEPSKPNNTGKVIGWTLAGIILVLLAGFFYQRYSKAKRRPINLLSFTKKR